MEPTWQTKCGSVKLWLGDCLDVLPTLEAGSVDAAVTDPPYGIGERLVRGGGGGGWHRMVASGANEWDVKPDQQAFAEIFRISAEQIIWGGNFFPLPTCEKPLCWDKVRPNQKNVSEWEYAWTSLTGRAEIFRYCANGGFILAAPRVHPTKKPLPLIEWCLSKIPNTRSVLDPFMGSGTTGVACVRTGRKFLGIEKEERYFNSAIKRIEAELNRAPLFDEAPVVQTSLLEDA
jgi:DNA modification methylase